LIEIVNPRENVKFYAPNSDSQDLKASKMEGITTPRYHSESKYKENKIYCKHMF